MRNTAIASVLIATTCGSAALAADPPAKEPTVAEFLAACAKSDPLSKSDCDLPVHINIISIGMVESMQGKRQLNICLPDDGDFAKLEHSIVEWLGKRAQMQSLPAEKGVGDAIAALYPCE